jgi:U4/U6.U5 tri-snRNP-associated protein 1
VLLEMSVDESNELRARLGLAPLRTSSRSLPGGVGVGGRVEEQHAPAANLGHDRAVRDRIERARLKRAVEQAMDERFAADSLAALGTNGANSGAADASAASPAAARAKSWAQQMRKQSRNQKNATANTINSGGVRNELPRSGVEGSAVVAGLGVAHRASDFEVGSTVTLTLQDASLLETDPDSGKALGLEGGSDGAADARTSSTPGAVLENVDLADAQRHRDGLRVKRQLEMGAGRAGAYAGFDDDEFEELGGTQAPSRGLRGGQLMDAVAVTKNKKKRIGFTLGSLMQEEEEEEESDLFAPQRGKAVSLEPLHADLVASDFMTIDEDETHHKKTKKKEAKFKSKKKDRKESRKNRRRVDLDDDDEVDDDLRDTHSGGKTLLEELEETAKDASSGTRKRRRDDSNEDEEHGEGDIGPRRVVSNAGDNAAAPPLGPATAGDAGGGGGADSKRAKFDAIMAKGSERTQRAFAASRRPLRLAHASRNDHDDEPDDTFLNAALTKARRLNRLKELSGSSSLSSTTARAKSNSSAAEAVAAAVVSLPLFSSFQHNDDPTAAPDGTKSSDEQAGGGEGGTVEFTVDETHEFARALQARTEQQQREAAKRKALSAVAVVKSEPKSDRSAAGAESQAGHGDDEGDDDVGMAELAKHVKPDDEEATDFVAAASVLEGTTGATVQLGRGLGGVLGLLRETGELTRKNAGKEELRGRAKDERHYEDYEDLDLSKVVKIDERTATDKDRELARRQVKLEWRDEHGRLLTRKEAFREMSKQFHGYGSGKRKAEKKLAQIAREQAEARQNSQASASSLGALQRTQKATGKAYVVHKT